MSVGRNIRIAGLLVLVVSVGTAWPQDSESTKDIYKAAETAANDGKTEESQKLYCQVAKLDPTFKGAKMLCKVMTEEIDRERKKNDERFKLGVQRFNESKFDEAQHEFANIKWGPHYLEAQRYLTVRIPQALQNQKQPLSTSITTPVALSTSGDDEAAVRRVIARYEDAYRARDAFALKQVWPTINSRLFEEVRTSFAMANSIRMTISIDKVNFTDVASATVTGFVNETTTPKRGSPHSSSDSIEFQVAKSDGVWTIRDLH